MNEQINVLKPYDVYGDNLQSLFRTVDWLQDHMLSSIAKMCG